MISKGTEISQVQKGSKISFPREIVFRKILYKVVHRGGLKRELFLRDRSRLDKFLMSRKERLQKVPMQMLMGKSMIQQLRLLLP